MELGITQNISAKQTVAYNCLRRSAGSLGEEVLTHFEGDRLISAVGEFTKERVQEHPGAGGSADRASNP
jgi:hypothetical protein